MSDKLDIKDLAMPSAAKIIAEKKLDVSKIQGTGLQGRITVSYTHLTLPTKA